MPLDVVLARVVEEHRAVAELVLVGRHAEDVRRQHQRRLPLVAVELVHGLAPVLAARDVALVLGDHERDAVDQQHRVLAALLHALHAVLVGRGEVVQVLPGGIELDEVHGLRVFARSERDLGAVAQQVEGLAIGREPVRVRHRLAQRRHGQLRLRLGLHLRVDAQNRRDQQRLHQRVFERPLVLRHGRLVPVRPAETARLVLGFGLAAEPVRMGCST